MEIFFFFKWLKHVLQINWFPSLWRLSRRHTSTALQADHIHNIYAQALFLLPVENSLSNHQGTTACSLTTFYALCHAFVHVFYLLILFEPFFFCLLLILLIFRVFSTYLLALFVKFPLIIPVRCFFFLTICILVLSNTRSLSLYARSFLVICLLFIWLSRSLSLYAGFFLIICMLFLLHSRSLSLYSASSLVIFILALVCCLSYSLNSGCDLARLFHSTVYCCLSLCLNCTELLSNISLSAFWTLSSVSRYLFLDLCLRAKSFCDCKYLSTIASAEGTFSIAELPTVLFLLNNSPLFDVADFPSPLFFAVFEFTSDVLVPILTTSLASVGCAALSSLLRTLSYFWRCLSLFSLNFRHALSMRRSLLYSSCNLPIISAGAPSLCGDFFIFVENFERRATG